MLKDFKQFIKDYNIIQLTIAFVMGAAANSLVGSLVKDVLMPIIQPLMKTDSWKNSLLQIGPVQISYGSFLAELINFILLAFFVYLIFKKIFKFENKNPEPPKNP
jgi:large conductance mechanosensitive channel